MASNKQVRQAARRGELRPANDTGGPLLFNDWQRRVVLMLLTSGMAFGVVGAFVAPRGAVYWLAVAAVPVLCAAFGYVLGGAPGRVFEARLLGGDSDSAAPRLTMPAALPAPARAALQAALLPALLAELAGAADRMAPPVRAAARALIEAAATAPEGAPRQALARDLPRLIAALGTGDAAAVNEAASLARQLAVPMPRPGGVP